MTPLADEETEKYKFILMLYHKLRMNEKNFSTALYIYNYMLQEAGMVDSKDLVAIGAVLVAAKLTATKPPKLHRLLRLSVMDFTEDEVTEVEEKMKTKLGTEVRSYHTIPYHTIPYHTIPYHTIPYHTIPYNTIPYHTMPCHAMPCHAIPYHTL